MPPPKVSVGWANQIMTMSVASQSGAKLAVAAWMLPDTSAARWESLSGATPIRGSAMTIGS